MHTPSFFSKTQRCRLTCDKSPPASWLRATGSRSHTYFHYSKLVSQCTWFVNGPFFSGRVHSTHEFVEAPKLKSSPQQHEVHQARTRLACLLLSTCDRLDACGLLLAMSNRDHGFLHPSNSISQRSAVSTHSHASGISGFLSNLARTVSNASSSSYGSSLQHQHSGNQSKILSPDSTFTGLSSGDRSLAEYDPAREPIKVSLVHLFGSLVALYADCLDYWY